MMKSFAIPPCSSFCARPRYGWRATNSSDAGYAMGIHWRGSDDIAAPLQEFVRLGGVFSRPATWLAGVTGYGLPEAGEREVLSDRLRADAGHRQAQLEALDAALPRLLSPGRHAALEGTEANVVLIRERLRALAADS